MLQHPPYRARPGSLEPEGCATCAVQCSGCFRAKPIEPQSTVRLQCARMSRYSRFLLQSLQADAIRPAHPWHNVGPSPYPG